MRSSTVPANGGAEIVKHLKTGSAYYAPSAAAVQMAESIVRNKRRILPAAAYLEGEYGQEGIYLGVPASWARAGSAKVVEVQLTESESASLARSADTCATSWRTCSWRWRIRGRQSPLRRIAALFPANEPIRSPSSCCTAPIRSPSSCRTALILSASSCRRPRSAVLCLDSSPCASIRFRFRRERAGCPSGARRGGRGSRCAGHSSGWKRATFPRSPRLSWSRRD